MVTLVNRAKVATATTGTGTITLGAAESGYQTFAAAGVADGDTVRYVIEDGNNWEIGTSLYTSTGTTLSRTVSESSNADAALNLTGSAVVYVSAAAEDIPTAYTNTDVDTHLNTSTATAGEVLSWTGSDYDWITTGGGGAALELYAENPVSPTAPSATGANAVAIGDGSTATNADAFAIGSLTNSAGIGSVAIGFNVDATGLKSLAIGAGTDATGVYASAIGTNSGNAGSQAVTGAGAMALGGSYASGIDSFAAAIANNTASYGATVANSVAIGQMAKTLGGVAIGSQALTTNYGIAISVIGLRGIGSTASSNGGCIAIGGNNTASAFSSVAIGQDAVSSDSGKFVFSPIRLAVNGDAQTGIKVVSASTTDATPKALSTGDFGETFVVILPNNSAYAFHGTIVARQQASQGTACAAWKIEGLIRREGSAGTTVLVNSATTILDNTPAWGMALSADTTNGGLKIEATGAAATNIRWVATINTSEVTY